MCTSSITNYAGKILAHIKGKEWVTIDELEQQIGLSKDKISLVLDFLEFAKFIDVGKGNDQIKINAFGNTFLNIP